MLPKGERPAFASLSVVVLILVFCLQVIGCTTLGTQRLERYLAQGNALMAAGDHEGAIELYRSVLQAHPQQRKIRYNLALAFVQAGNPDAALEELSRLDAQADHRNVTYLTAIGGVAAASGKGGRAIEAWKRVLELDPLDVKVRELLVDELARQQAFSEAYRYAAEAFRLGQFSKELFAKLAELEVRSGSGDGNSWKLLEENHT